MADLPLCALPVSAMVARPAGSWFRVAGSDALQHQPNDMMVLGSGKNILITDCYDIRDSSFSPIVSYSYCI